MDISYGKKMLVALTAAFTLFYGNAYAETISLKEARDEALKANIDLNISREKVTQTMFLSKESYTKLFPELSLSSSGNYLGNETAVSIERGAYGTFPGGPVPASDVKIITMENNVAINGGIKLEQPVFAGGRIYYSYMGAESTAEVARWNEKSVIQNTLYNVEVAYFNLLKADDLIKLAEDHENNLKVHLADMELLYKRGRASLNDVLKVKVQLSEAKLDTIKRENSISTAQMQLNLLLNRPLHKTIDAIALDKPHEVALNMDEAVSIAMSNNKSLRSKRTERTTAMYDRKVAEADYYPNVTLATEFSAQSGQPSYPDNQWSVVLSMDWPLWQWGGTKDKVSAARAYERQIDFAISSLESQIAASVRDVYLKMREIDKRIEVDKERLEEARENLRITRIGFDNGVRTSTDVLDAEGIYSNALSAEVQDLYDTYIARAQLRYVMSMMEVDDISKVAAPSSANVLNKNGEGS